VASRADPVFGEDCPHLRLWQHTLHPYLHRWHMHLTSVIDVARKTNPSRTLTSSLMGRPNNMRTLRRVTGRGLSASHNCRRRYIGFASGTPDKK
jgi:hypothetical protein